MPKYLVSVKSSANHYRAMVTEPEDREQSIRDRIRKFEATLLGFFYGNGNMLYMIAEFPDSKKLYTVLTAMLASGEVEDIDVVEIFSGADMVNICKSVKSNFNRVMPS